MGVSIGGQFLLSWQHYDVDDNNTRVLYERVLSSMPVESTQEIWEKFMDFESSVGDLTGLIKVEKRRGVAMKDVSCYKCYE